MTGWRAHTGAFAWPTVGLFVAVFAGEVAVWWGVLSERLPMWAGTLVATVLAYMAFTVLHEAVHGNVHGDRARLRTVSEVAGRLSGITLLAPYSMFRVLHLQHHSSTNDPEKDPDYWVRGSNPFSIVARCFTVLAAYFHSFFAGASSQTHAGQEKKWIAIVETGALFVLAGVLVAVGLGMQALWLWIVPAALAVAVLGFFFDWLPHHPHNVQERFLDTRIIVIPGITIPLLWQNYHLIHHLYPRVPFYRYAACFADEQPTLEAKGCLIQGVGYTRAAPEEHS